FPAFLDVLQKAAEKIGLGALDGSRRLLCQHLHAREAHEHSSKGDPKSQQVPQESGHGCHSSILHPGAADWTGPRASSGAWQPLRSRPNWPGRWRTPATPVERSLLPRGPSGPYSIRTRPMEGAALGSANCGCTTYT